MVKRRKRSTKSPTGSNERKGYPQEEESATQYSLREYVGWFGTLVIMLVLPASALILQTSCSVSKCDVVNIPYNWREYLDYDTAKFYVIFIALLALPFALPWMRHTDANGYVRDRTSGILTAMLTILSLAAVNATTYDVSSLLRKSVPLLTTAILLAFLLAIVLFRKGRHYNRHSSTNYDESKLYDFFIGRDPSPTIWCIIIKPMLFRLEFISILVLDTLYLLKYMETHILDVYSPTLLCVVVGHLIYIADFLWFKDYYMETLEARENSVGYRNCMAAAVWPFLTTLVTRYIFYSKYEASTLQLVICGIFYFIGFIIFRCSTALKAEIKKNPHNPIFTNYKTIATSFYEDQLLCGTWWGWVRHPNYVGLMLMMWSISATCGLSHWLPYVFPALHTAVLIHRSFRISARYKNIYGDDWVRYTQVVKYRLIPGLF